ncbi:MAG: hypothetical protein C0424_03035 [Sphingobacteriaceae bacterium]|nr:hypothetical protein [Sphingobacteriaceae bacterium]
MPKSLFFINNVRLFWAFLLVLISQGVNAQFAQDWRFGYAARIVFTANPPSGAPGSQLFSEDGSVSISNTAGNLLFCSSGESVRNRNDVVMTNGSDLKGGTSVTQGTLAIPFPGQANRYLLFTLGRTVDTMGLNYSVIDMAQSGGLGAVVPGQKNLPLLAGSPTNLLTEKMAATQHCNGQDYWVLVHRYNSNQFIKYRVTSAGVDTPILQSIGTAHTPLIGTNPTRAQKGYMVFSPDGRKLALTLNGPNSNNLIEVFDFDKTTGVLSNPLRLPARGGEYGLAFSPDNGKLFVSGGIDSIVGGTGGSYNHLHVFNMVAQNPVTTKELVLGQWRPDSRRYAALQNAPDGKIYHVLTLIDALNSISNPNSSGPFIYQDSIVFPINGTTRRGLPNFVNDEFSLPFIANFSYEFTCVGQAMQFYDSSLANARSWRWDFGDGTTLADTSNQRFPTYIYSTPGTYNVTLIASDGCGSFDTIVKPVEVGLRLPVSLGADSVFACVGDTVRLSSNITSGSFVWSTGSPGAWIPSATDTFPNLEVTSTGWYRLEADNGNCSGADSVYVFVNTNPITVDLGPDFELCLGSTDILDAENAGATSYLWSTGDATRTITVNSPGTYWVLVNDRGCFASDTIIVTLDTLSTIQVMPDTSVCPGDEIILSAAGFGVSYLWSTGASTAAITVNDTGNYIVEVTTSNGCILSDTIRVRYRCDTRVYFPTAFTPNGDRLNDVFMPALRSADLGTYELLIYDRWGRLVFNTTRIDVGWDGKINGVEAPPGAYQYLCNFYTNVQRVNTFQSGTFFLIR